MSGADYLTYFDLASAHGCTPPVYPKEMALGLPPRYKNLLVISQPNMKTGYIYTPASQKNCLYISRPAIKIGCMSPSQPSELAVYFPANDEVPGSLQRL